mgnify:CR=1 FL=1
MVCALPHLSLAVIHEAAAEGHYLAIIHHGRMPASTLDLVLVLRAIVDVAPLGQTLIESNAGHDPNGCYLLVGVIILAADQINLRSDGDHAGVFARCRQPVLKLPL